MASAAQARSTGLGSASSFSSQWTDHGSWGIACVIKGRDRYRHYGIEDGRVTLLYERELAPGSFVTWPEPPDDLHSQQGIDEPAWELPLFGKDVMRIPRHYHDLETGKVRTALPQ